MEKTVLLLVVAVILTGCVGGDTSPEPEEVRDGFVGSGNDVSSYAYESETTLRISAVGGAGTQTTTITTDAVLDYDDRALRAEQVTRERAQETRTTRYVVNGTAYDRTVNRRGDTGWIPFDEPAEVDQTWDGIDELGFYTRVLENASVSAASQEEETVEGADTRALSLELSETERMGFLSGKFRDDPGFLSDLRIEEFNTTVWMSEEENRLVRAETEVSAVAPEQQTQAGVLDMRAQISFVDEFSYDEPVEIELPEEARNTSSG